MGLVTEPNSGIGDGGGICVRSGNHGGSGESSAGDGDGIGVRSGIRSDGADSSGRGSNRNRMTLPVSWLAS